MVAAVSLVFVLAVTGLSVMVMRVIDEGARRSDQLVTVDTIALAVSADELATSALDLAPELRDDVQFETIHEGVRSNIEAVEASLAQLEMAPSIAAKYQTVLDGLRSVVDSEVESVDPAVAIGWSGDLRSATRELLSTVSSWFSPELAAARSAAAARQRSIVLSWRGPGALDRAGVAEIDDAGDLVVIFSAAAQREVGAATVASSAVGLMVFAALTAVASILGVLMLVGVRREGYERIRKLTHGAHQDPLTGLCNRAQLEHIARKIRPTKEGHVGLLFVALDGFTEIVGRRGHRVGDEVLRIVADRLRSAVRSGDAVARIGADEFVVLLPNVDDPADIVAVADRVVAGVRETSIIEGEAVMVDASVGAAVASSRSFDLRRTLLDADAALHDARCRGMGHVVASQELARELAVTGS